jgi:hypothetical protein
MKDSFDMGTDVRSLINVPAILNLIDGKIYPDTRPTGRAAKTDIVINTVGVNNLQFQKGTANINIYAPNLKTTQEDGSVQYLPNYAKLTALCKAIKLLVDNQWKATFRTEVTDPGTLLQDTDGGYFISMQLAYESYNKEYNNF